MKTEKLKKLLVCLFDLWKTFPDAVKTAVLVASVTAFFAFWAGNQPPGTQTPQNPAPTNLSVKNSPSEAPPIQRPVSPPHHVIADPVSELAKPVPHLSEAQKTIERGSYAESYRQSLEILRSLPEHEQRRIASQSDEAARSYERGDFREAAYIIQQAIGSTH